MTTDALTPESRIPLPDLGGRARLARPMDRLQAQVVDGFLGAISLVVGMILGLGVQSVFGREDLPYAFTVCMVGAFVALWTYQLFLLGRSGQTLGKRMASVRIVRSDGSKPGFGRIFWLRTVLPTAIGFIPALGTIFGLVDVLAIFGQSRQCIHDTFADTVVVDLRTIEHFDSEAIAEVFA